MPPYCSACYDQKPDKRYVDFDAASDRGWADDGQAMDDLIICEDCLRSGAVHIDMCDTREIAAELERLRHENQRLKTQRDRSDTYSRKLEDTLRERPVPVELPTRPRRT